MLRDKEKKEMGQRFREFRESLGMSRKQMAILTNVSVYELKEMEHGQRSITTRRLCRLSKDSKINPHWIVTGVHPPSEEEKKAMARAKLYQELRALLEVPEIAELIRQELKIAKLNFKDQIKKFNLP